MALSVKSLAASGAVALAVTAAGALGVTGTAFASTPGHAVTAGTGVHAPDAPHPPGPPHPPPPHRPPPPPPHRFRARFHTLQQCQFRARHDHPGHDNFWDCRRGPDRNNPWEYWGA